MSAHCGLYWHTISWKTKDIIFSFNIIFFNVLHMLYSSHIVLSLMILSSIKQHHGRIWQFSMNFLHQGKSVRETCYFCHLSFPIVRWRHYVNYWELVTVVIRAVFVISWKLRRKRNAQLRTHVETCKYLHNHILFENVLFSWFSSLILFCIHMQLHILKWWR